MSEIQTMFMAILHRCPLEFTPEHPHGQPLESKGDAPIPISLSPKTPRYAIAHEEPWRTNEKMTKIAAVYDKTNPHTRGLCE
jgi:hypothetical protein